MHSKIQKEGNVSPFLNFQYIQLRNLLNNLNWNNPISFFNNLNSKHQNKVAKSAVFLKIFYRQLVVFTGYQDIVTKLQIDFVELVVFLPKKTA